MLESIQAKIVGGLSILTLILAVIATGKNIGIVSAVLIFFVYSVYILLITYDVNCTIQGYCGVWAWVKTGFVAFASVMLIVASITMLVKGKGSLGLAPTLASAPKATTPAPAAKAPATAPAPAQVNNTAPAKAPAGLV